MASNRYTLNTTGPNLNTYNAKDGLDGTVDGETIVGLTASAEYATYGDRFNHGFWVNDLYFEVPPERISSQEENSYAEFQSLRSNSASKVPVGIASEIFSINLNIPSKNSIVNIDDRTSESGTLSQDFNINNTQKRGGILDLIIQFKHIPFSVIENAFLRAKLKIPHTHNMVFCMHNLAISTSPGEPGTIVATLTVSPMGYTPYSDKWLFKKNWDAKSGSSFYDVNMNYAGILSKLPNWNKYPSRLQESDLDPEKTTYYFGSKDWTVNPKLTADSASQVTTTESDLSVVNPAYQTIDSVNSLDQNYMVKSDITQFAYESSLYKQYIDWLHARWAQKIVNNNKENELNRYDFTQISPYGSENHNLGDSIILKWKEFKSISIDPEVADIIRTYFKRKLALDRARLFKIRFQEDGQVTADGYDQNELAAFRELEKAISTSGGGPNGNGNIP
mgnify:CR=1 FL=1|jgi:hypothetical protein